MTAKRMEWFLIIYPVVADTNKGIDKTFSNPEDTSFVKRNSEYPRQAAIAMTDKVKTWTQKMRYKKLEKISKVLQ